MNPNLILESKLYNLSTRTNCGTILNSNPDFIVQCNSSRFRSDIQNYENRKVEEVKSKLFPKSFLKAKFTDGFGRHWVIWAQARS